MFPNIVSPLTAPFMVERARALSKISELSVIAPVSFFPFIKQPIPPMAEEFCGLQINHPRYLRVPSFLWSLRWISYYIMCWNYWRGKLPNCDIIHMEWIYPDAYALMRYINSYSVRTIAVIHGNEAIGYFEDKHHRNKYIEVLNKINRIIVVSDELKNKLVSEYLVPAQRVRVILNGVNLNEFPLCDKFTARKQLSLPLNQNIGVCIARLSIEKNINILIDAISLLNNKDLNIYIIGDGPLRATLESHIKRMNIKDKIKMIGALPHNQIYRWLNAADFFCLPSEREGCPVVVHEALACGLPVISTTVGAIPDLVCSDDYGLLCPPSDALALSANIAEALSRHWNRDKIASYGRRFTWDEVARQTKQVFDEVIR